MSFQLALSKTSITADCITLVFSDTTGNYPTPLTGYGTPNPARNTLYMKVFVNLRQNNGRQPVLVPSYNYNTAASWSVTLSQDGWYEIYAFSTIVYDAGTTYALGYITYDISSNTFYKSIQAGNIGHAVTNVSWWLPTTDITDYINATAIVQPNAYDVTFDDVELCRSAKCKANALFQAAEQDDDCSPDNDFAIQPYTKIRLRYEAALVAAALQNYSDAQEFVDDMNKICVKCGCQSC